VNYYSFHIADFALHTNHLSLEEEAVYRKLLDYYYDTEAPIPTETQPVIRRLRLGSYENTVKSILVEFFILEDDGWHNLRADEEIISYYKKAETARSNGKKGGRPKKNKNLQKQKPKETQPVILANPDITQQKANQEPRTNSNKGRFTPPNVKEIQSYCQERNNSVDAQKFFDHYESNGWFRGKTKIKDWKACVRTWEIKEQKPVAGVRDWL